MMKYLFNCLFVFLCFILVSIGWFLTNETESKSENRALSAFPPLIINKKINLNFDIDFEKAWVDHLIVRKKVIDIYSLFMNSLNKKGNKHVLIGKDQWLFHNAFENKHNFHNIKSYQRKFLLSQAEIIQITSELKRTADWARQHNIKVYLIVPPEKPQIYDDFFPQYILRHNNPPIHAQISQLIPNDITYIPLEEVLKKSRKNSSTPLYWKTDTHWNYSASFIGYTELMQTIKHDFPYLKSLKRSNFNIIQKETVIESEGKVGGVLYSMLKNPKYKNNTSYEFFINRVPPKTTKKQLSTRYVTYNTTNALNKLNVVIYHDSYGNYMMDFLKNTFSDLKAIRFNPPKETWGILLNKEQSDILTFKPDILIFEISELKLIELKRIWGD